MLIHGAFGVGEINGSRVQSLEGRLDFGPSTYIGDDVTTDIQSLRDSAPTDNVGGASCEVVCSGSCQPLSVHKSRSVVVDGVASAIAEANRRREIVQ